MSVFRTVFISFILLTLLVLTVVPGWAQGPDPQKAGPPATPEYVPGEILVKFQPHVGTLGAQRSLEAEGLRPVEVSSRGRLWQVQVEPGREAEAIARLKKRGDVEIASYNHIVYAAFDPDDYYYVRDYQWALSKIEAPAAWDISTGSGDVIVAVVDSGLDTSHEEFSGRIVFARDEIEDDSVPQDNCQHGTHVTGIIAAQGNNSQGIAGMAWNVKVMPVRVLNGSPSSCTGTEKNIHDAIDWAVSHGAKIINLSLGGLPSSGHTCEQDYPTMSSAIADAYDAGVLVVAASGNDSASWLACPALQAQTMAVGSTTASDVRASYSNYGTGLNIVAPGGMWGDWTVSIYSTIPGDYGTNQGTSMAAPHVSGLAALLWSVDPSLTHSEVQTIIQNTADDLGAAGYDLEYGHGRINAGRALEPYSLQSSPDQLTTLMDDDSSPVERTIQVTTASSNVITWTASISPGSSWLSMTPPDSGTITAASSPVQVTLVATNTLLTYGTYTTTVTITGTTETGRVVGPTYSEVKLSYVPELYEYRFPLIFKNWSGP
ncbi:MAG: S8 family serine peptidase [Anaerolineae bacterium]|nr:S8 family serine peptidase [Anaerolineae bacterium]